jgi:hypothetical protein
MFLVVEFGVRDGGFAAAVDRRAGGQVLCRAPGYDRHFAITEPSASS